MLQKCVRDPKCKGANHRWAPVGNSRGLAVTAALGGDAQVNKTQTESVCNAELTQSLLSGKRECGEKRETPQCCPV